ncbi:MAG: hypothetical protein QXD70_05080, partial [Candidatus Bathyarchaeia archaeon]
MKQWRLQCECAFRDRTSVLGDCTVWGVLVGNYVTNSSGICAVPDWKPRCNVVYEVKASFSGNALYAASSGSSSLDLRFPTNVTSVEGDCLDVTVGVPRTYELKASTTGPAFYDDWSGWTRLYINGTFKNGTVIKRYMVAVGSANGSVSFTWAAPSEGTYCIRTALLAGKFGFPEPSSYRSCECFLGAAAVTRPLAVQFNVSRTEFVVGEGLVLNATVL